MKQQFVGFLIRLVVSTLALYVCVWLFGESAVPRNDIFTFFVAGLIFSIINTTLKPIITVLSLPFILVTLGLFTLIINGLMVWLAISLAPGLAMSFWGAVWSGIIMSIANYSINVITSNYKQTTN
ncbi:MAG: phage holin family protein [Candidatus Nomurabacteria bacterium]|jgi:putative membrane protein|nr:phage holin family protein [Candidatus Nomurabacteria bacterium]